MINYPIKSSDNKLTYGLGIDLSKNKYESKIIIQFSDLDNQQQVRVSLDGEELRKFMIDLNEYRLHYF